MSAAEATTAPVEAMRRWLLSEWTGPLRPIWVEAAEGEDYSGADAWFFTVTFPAPDGETWDVEQMADLNRAFRDKAIDVGLPYPWYVLPQPPAELDVVPEDDEDLPDG